jgi:hypothetical protein
LKELSAMKTLKKATLLILGILVATFTILCQVSVGEPKNLEDLEKEQFMLIETILNEIEVQEKNASLQDNLYKIFNNDNKLVFETRNAEDQKLKSLINKSDLLTTINNISYYKLSR